VPIWVKTEATPTSRVVVVVDRKEPRETGAMLRRCAAEPDMVRCWKALEGSVASGSAM